MIANSPSTPLTRWMIIIALPCLVFLGCDDEEGDPGSNNDTSGTDTAADGASDAASDGQDDQRVDGGNQDATSDVPPGDGSDDAFEDTAQDTGDPGDGTSDAADAADDGNPDDAMTDADAPDTADTGDTPDTNDTGDTGLPDLSGLNDDFETADSHAGWSILNGDDATVTEADGVLRIVPLEPTVWLNANSAVFVYKPITAEQGNLAINATVSIENWEGNAPDGPWDYGGLMIRLAEPTSDGDDGEDYLFITLGHNNSVEGVEGKNTDNSDSFWGQISFDGDVHPEHPVNEPLVRELRLCKVGGSARGFFRPVGGDWTELMLTDMDTDTTYFPASGRNDLDNAALQVGMIGYANDEGGGLTVEFGEIEFESVGVLEDCAP